MKRLKIILLCLVCAFTLCGCLPHSELNEQAIVEAIGIDYADGKYEVTVQYFNMEATGGNAPIDTTKANVVNITGHGDSVSAALESASVKCGKSFMYGITGVIVLGREALHQDILKTLSFAESYYHNNTSALVAAADGKASDILAVKFKDGVISVEHLKLLLKNAHYYGLSESMEILRLLREQRRTFAGSVLPVLAAMESGEGISDDGKTVHLTGGMLIADRTYAADLSLAELSGLQLLSEHPANSLVSVSYNSDKVNVTIYDINTEIKHSINDGVLCYTINIRADGKYTDSQLENKDLTFSQQIEAMCAEELNKRLETALNAAVKNTGCDPCGLKYVISSSDYPLWLRICDNFGEFLRGAEFYISTDIDIDRFGIIH